MPIVSVILPNYNHAQYLTQRIESILNQTYQDFELIILDDCSTDNSKEIIDAYKSNPKISHLVFSEKNTGNPFEQWYNGVKLAKGEFVWIAESDDWAEPNFLSELVTKIQQDNNIGLVYCNSVIEIDNQFISDFSSVKNKRFNTTHWAKSHTFRGVEEINQFLLRDCTIKNASAVLIRRELLEKILPIHEQFRLSGDWFCYLRIASFMDISYLHCSLNHYREHSVNTSKLAGYNYLKEVFYMYDWVLKNKIAHQDIVLKAFDRYTSDLYSGDLKWNFIKDFRLLLPINSLLFRRLTRKNMKRFIKKHFQKFD